MGTSRFGRSKSFVGRAVQDIPPPFSQVQIKNFRGIRDLVIEELAPINIFTGRNGSGKTSVLEAIWLICSLNNAGLVEVIARARTLPIFPSLDLIFTSLFPNFDVSTSVLLSASVGPRREAFKRTLEIRRLEPGGDMIPLGFERAAVPGVELIARVGEHSLPPGRIAFARVGYDERGEPAAAGFPVADAVGLMVSPFVEHEHFVHAAFLRPGWRAPQRVYDLVARATRNRKLDPVVELLRSVFPELKSIVPLAEGNVPMIYADVGGSRLMPAPMFGSGFCNLLDIAIWVGASEARMLIIDEIEDGLHYTAFPMLAKSLLEINRRKGLQIFIATHSRDVVSAFGDAARETPEMVRFFKLYREGDATMAARFSVEDWQKLDELGGDIR